jgi:hypothetical protein
MPATALNVLSGIGAAVAGLNGEKVSGSGAIPGLDIAAMIPAMLGSKSEGGAGNLLGSIASAAAKSGLVKDSNIMELAGNLLSVDKSKGAPKKADANTVAALASAVLSCTGKGDLASIAAIAIKLASSVKDKKGLLGIAAELGKTLASSGVSFKGAGTALKALDKVTGGDIKGELFKTVLKALA